MQRRAIVHIGMPRTGTTAVQTILHEHRAALAERGILYPFVSPVSEPLPSLNHQHLGQALNGRRPLRERAELLATLKRQIDGSGARVVLVSYEGLALLPAGSRAPAELASLFEALGFAMETLLTVRPQAELITSHYTLRTDFLREGRTFAAAFRRDVMQRRLDLGAVLSPWSKVSRGGFRVVPLSDRRSRRPLLQRILESLSLDKMVGPLMAMPDLAFVANRSAGPFAVEISRRLGSGAPTSGPGPSWLERSRPTSSRPHGRGASTSSRSAG